MTKRNRQLPALSIFFPAYNEAANIEETIKQALAVAPKVAKRYEVIIVNDGSKDSTRQIVERLVKKNHHIRLINQQNQGYGGALKRGFTEARYDWVFFSDADLQFDLGELRKLVVATHQSDLILGYRLNRAEGWKRQLFATALKFWNRLLLGFPRQIKDIDCAFKLINKRVLIATNPLLSNGAMVSTELLLKAHRLGIHSTQIGVHHYQRRAGNPTGNNLTVIIKAVVDTFRLQWQLSHFSLQQRLAGINSLLYTK